ncbi:hypothetical protein EDD11_001366 [Mortierella claussenii]|nr:hypothetical protein EDD11_001366 [Mortierella claussenii]
MPTRNFNSPSSPAFTANPSSPYYYPQTQGSGNTLLGSHQDSLCVLTNGDVVHFSAFDWIDAGSNLKNKSSRRFCLLLGYADGFQIWDITHPDNIHEIVSIRNTLKDVSFLKVLPSPRIPTGKVDQFEQYRPLVAIISNNSAEDGASTPKKLQIYSLAKHQVVKKLDFGEGPDYDISALDVSERGIVVALTALGESTHLFLISPLTLQPLHPKQVVLQDAAYPGVFDLGTRLLAYVTTSEAPNENTESKHGEHEAEGGTAYQDLAKGVAKEVFGGVKLLGGIAHQTFSSYWSGNSGGTASTSTSPPVQSGFNRSPNRHTRRASASADQQDRNSNHVHHRRRHDDNSPHKREAVGTIIVRDISLPTMPIVAHFKPHDHPITGCKFSPSGRLLLTVSRHGNVFHVHEVRPTAGPGSRHLYKLARGITHASVEDIVFNEDETWVAVTTSRGTTHLYAINPFGGSPDVGAHMYTGVINWTATAIEYPTPLNALCRIKQRHHVPEIILSEGYGLEGLDGPIASPPPPEKRRGSLHRQSSQDSLSSVGTGTSDQSQGYLSRLQQHHGITGGGKQRAMIAAYFLPSSTIFASDPGNVVLSPGEYSGHSDGPFGGPESGDLGRGDGPNSQVQANSSTLLINRSKAPPVSTAARLQSKASHLWQTLSPPAAAVVQHAAHGLASLPGLVVETSRRGPVATVRSRTMSWTGSHTTAPSAKHQSSTKGEAGTNGTYGHGAGAHTNGASTGGSDVPLAVQQQLASQGSLSEPERGPSFADIYVFNPLGILTLHRCWVSSVRSKKTFNGRVVETSDLVLAPEDVAEWTLNRSSDWAPVKRSLAPLTGQKTPQQNKPKKTASSGIAGSRWLAQAEISTYDSGMHSGWKGQYPLLNQTLAAHGASASTVTLTQPQHLLWKSPQFSFQTYVGSLESIQQEFKEGRLPEARTQNLRRGISLVAGKDGRPVGAASPSTRTVSKPWISGVATVQTDNAGDHEHGRIDSHDSEAEGLSENLSSAIASNLHRHSSSPINQSRMSPSVGSVSPSSFRAATLSFEDAHLISLGNASGSPKQAFSGSMSNQQPHYTQHTFLSTPPAEYTAKGRQGSLSGTSPGSVTLGGNGIPTMTAYANTPSSSISPLASSFGESMSLTNGNDISLGANGHGTTDVRVAAAAAQGRQTVPSRKAGSPSPFGESPKLAAMEKSAQPSGAGTSVPNVLNGSQQNGVNPMAQSTMMMFSPDGDNEVDMPGSASIYLGVAGQGPGQKQGHRLLQQGRQRNGGGSSVKGGGDAGSILPQGAVFALDDDFSGGRNGADGRGPEDEHNQKLVDVMSNGQYGQYDSVLGRGRSKNHLDHHQRYHQDYQEFLDQDDDEDYDFNDDGSLI